MKRFLLFAGKTYYPGGGFSDLVDDFDSVEEVKAAANKNGEAKGFDGANWFHMIDLTEETKMDGLPSFNFDAEGCPFIGIRWEKPTRFRKEGSK